MVLVSDYSTETGLRVRMSCDTTGTTIQIPAGEWKQLLLEIKAGKYDGLAEEPLIPFKY